MKKQAVLYIRVSSEKQAAENTVSIDQQLQTNKALCESLGVEIVEVFVDKERYVKTKFPYKGKLVEPSGKYDDRPGFLTMLSRIEQGDIDLIVAFDSTRLGRHLRVLGTLANSLDIANQSRNGKEEVQIWESSKHTALTRLMLGIMISLAQEENEIRTKRFKMGRVGTLQQGRWPGVYIRFGYDTIEEEGKRGVKIILNEQEAQTVKLIFDLAETKSQDQIRDVLIARKLQQKKLAARDWVRKNQWTPGLIRRILRSEHYTGKAKWTFGDGTTYTIEIPQIITPEQFARVQRRIDERKAKSLRNTKAIAALQHIAYCGQCKAAFTFHKADWYYKKLVNGTKKKLYYKIPRHNYRCANTRIKEHRHTGSNIYGPSLDKQVWRFLVDKAIKRPELIQEQVMNRRAELQKQGDGTDSEITHAKRELKEIGAGRDRLMNQLTKGLITEDDFERVMLQRNKDQKYWQEELARLENVRDESEFLLNGLNIVYEILSSYEQRVAEFDIPDSEYRRLSPDEQRRILLGRKQIIQALCEKVWIYPNGRIKIDGLIDVENCETSYK